MSINADNYHWSAVDLETARRLVSEFEDAETLAGTYALHWEGKKITSSASDDLPCRAIKGRTQGKETIILMDQHGPAFLGTAHAR